MSGTKLTPGRMTVSQIETVLGKAIRDPTIAAKLKSDPTGALTDMGYSPHPEEVQFFQSLGSGGFPTAAADLNAKDPQHYSAEL
jgi:hypothetical protein